MHILLGLLPSGWLYLIISVHNIILRDCYFITNHLEWLGDPQLCIKEAGSDVEVVTWNLFGWMLRTVAITDSQIASVFAIFNTFIALLTSLASEMSKKRKEKN